MNQHTRIMTLNNHKTTALPSFSMRRFYFRNDHASMVDLKTSEKSIPMTMRIRKGNS